MAAPDAKTPNKKPTIDDVAALSGVARVTVSRVLNGGANVRPEVREKVRGAVESLGYRVNVQARALAGGASRLFTLVHPAADDSEPNSYWESALELGALRACTRNGFHLMTRRVARADWTNRGWVRELIEHHRCDGIILTPPFADDVALAEFIRASGCVVVAIAPGSGARQTTLSVGIDDERAGYEIAAHLADLGHSAFAFIGGLEGHFAAEKRWVGVVRALADKGLGGDAIQFARGDFSFKSGVDLTPDLLAGRKKATALICANDDMAVGALFAAHRMGIAVPQHLSITGFDDTPVSALIWPPLTTIHQPIRKLGERAVDLLVEGMSSKTPRRKPGFELLPHELVIRHSTAVAPQRGMA
ncbi:MAG TPA: LacI family transcriptional regulator [Parvularcula sp.]|nr:LacI family transcriptional regulator [Parvularcula sp.]HBS31765.1 LacI family transcriptional regulator [Parvularcula sp.]HBS34605.1 LacI family transcriptional regulator [Parvularcula sp.]